MFTFALILTVFGQVALAFEPSSYEVFVPVGNWSFGIVGGSEVKLGKYPYMVSILKKPSHKRRRSAEEKTFYLGKPIPPQWYHHCGGTILNDDTILTAAHCLNKNKAARVYIGHVNIKFGLEKNFDMKYLFKVKEAIFSKSFHDGSEIVNGNDIGVIKLDRKIEFDKLKNVAPVCLAAPEAQPKGSGCVVMGWGEMENGKGPTNMLISTEPIIESSKCNQYKHDPKTMICAGHISGGKTGACKGDSGGPLICPDKNNPKDWIQFGIVSFLVKKQNVRKCGSLPTFYTRVSHFIPWIKEHAEK